MRAAGADGRGTDARLASDVQRDVRDAPDFSALLREAGTAPASLPMLPRLSDSAAAR